MSDMPSVEPRHETRPASQRLEQERFELLHRLEDWLETPLLILGFAWLMLLILELVYGESLWFETFGTVIWIVFLVDFALKFFIAPHKLLFLRSNWLTVIALLVPALRLLRIVRLVSIFRLARASRGLRLFRLVSSVNRGMRALGASMKRRGFGYVVALTVLVTFTGAAGMVAFENESPGGLNSYGEALWWTAMIMTTMGSQYWPQTVEGRLLCIALALYAFAVFGYVTATLASYFIDRDAALGDPELAGARAIAALRQEIAALRSEIRALARHSPEE